MVRSLISGMKKVTNLCPGVSDDQEVYIAVFLLRDHVDLETLARHMNAILFSTFQFFKKPCYEILGQLMNVLWRGCYHLTFSQWVS